MIQSLPLPRDTSGASLLHVAELTHRIRNEYMRAISFASLMATKTGNQEAKSVLGEIIRHLHSIAQTHGVLTPPLAEGVADLGETLARLCRALARSTEIEHRGVTLFYSFDEPVLIDARRCWRAALIISELINNACRHAFGHRSGAILVAVVVRLDDIVCTVSDDGSSGPSVEAGLGTQLIDALAAEINGAVNRSFGECGTTITLSFPKEDGDRALLRSRESPSRGVPNNA
jgi:two-component sensor histidine kinase